MKMRFLIFCILILTLLTAMSCGYGFLNLSSETGRIELEFDFVDVNTRNVNKIEYELTPPKGFTTRLQADVNGSVERRDLDRADIGTWTLRIILYAGDAAVQEFDYNLEVVNGSTTMVRMEASWLTDAYQLDFIVSQWSDSGDGGGEETEPAFTFSDIRINPGVAEKYHNGERFYSVNTIVSGSGFSGNLQLFKLIYPDGKVYEFGESGSSGRGLPLYHRLEDGMIEIHRTIGYGEDVLTGTYNLRMLDYSGRSLVHEVSLSLDYSLLMPVIKNASVPENIPITTDFIFDYDFGTASTTGTRLVYLVNKFDPGEVHVDNWLPADNSMAVGTTAGTFTLPAASMNIGTTYQFVLAAVAFQTTTPMDDVLAAGVEPDLRDFGLVGSINDIYGENTGYIIAKVVEFTAVN